MKSPKFSIADARRAFERAGMSIPTELSNPPKSSLPRAESHLEAGFDQLARAEGWPLDYEPDFEFHATRKFAFDRAWLKYRVAVELDGMTRHGKGRHSKGEGYTDDCEKLAEAQLHGWIVIKLDATLLNSHLGRSLVLRALQFRGYK